MAANVNTPPLPPGFVLQGNGVSNNATPPLPEGFVLQKEQGRTNRNNNGIGRRLGRTGRTMAVGATSIADAPRLVTDPLFTAGYYAADAVGAEGVRDWFGEQVAEPYFAERTRGAIDEATNNKYAPRNITEQIEDVTGEVVTSMMTPATLQKLGVMGYKALSFSGNKLKSFFSGSDDIDDGTKRAVNILLEEGKTPDEIIQIAEQAKKQPVKTTLFEQADSPKGLSMQRVLAEQPNKAGTVLSEYNKARLTDDIPETVSKVSAAKSSTTSPLVAGSKIQGVADDIIRDAIKARQDRVKPLYDIDVKKPVQGIDDLAAKNPAIAAAKNRVDTDPALQQLLQTEGIQPGTAGYLEKVRGELSRLKNVATKDITKLDQQSAAGYSRAIDKIDDLLKREAPGVVKGREEFAAASPAVRKLQEGIVGKLAKAKSPEKAADIIMREAPDTIRNVRNQFLQKDPQAWQDLTAAFLTEQGDKSRSLANYLSYVDKNKVTQEKLRSLLTPAQYRANRLLVANLRAIQKGLPRNSETLAKALATAELEGSKGAEALARSMVNEGGIYERSVNLALYLLRNTTGRFNQSSKASLAKALTSPDIEEIGKALAKVKPGSREAIDIIEPYLLPYIGAAGSTSQNRPRALETPDMRNIPQIDNQIIQGGVDASRLGGGQRDDFLNTIQRSLREENMATGNTPGNSNTPAPVAKPDMSRTGDNAIDSIIAEASQIGGIDNDYMRNLAMAESSLNPNARAKTSSAKGLYQFTDGTWNTMVKRYGKQHNIGKDDVLNPRANALMASLLQRDNKRILENKVGREVDSGELYAAHFLGVSNAAKLIQNRDSNASAASLFPSAAKANRSIFYANTKARKPSEVLEILEKKVSG